VPVGRGPTAQIDPIRAADFANFVLSEPITHPDQPADRRADHPEQKLTEFLSAGQIVKSVFVLPILGISTGMTPKSSHKVKTIQRRTTVLSFPH
jgi:hypothetical protein